MPGPTSTETQGLTIVGVHTPEFGFERDVDNITAQARALRRRLPDRDRQRVRRLGGLRQPLLAGRLPRRRGGTHPVPPLRRGRVRDDRDGHPAAADGRGRARRRPGPRRWSSPRGSRWPPTGGRSSRPRRTSATARAAASPPNLTPRSTSRTPYSLPPLRLNQWALAGTWTVARHAGVLNEPNGRIAFRFHARDVNLVMGPASRGASVPFRVFLDGQPAGAASGVDVDASGGGTVDAQRTYQLIRQSGPISERLVRDRVPRRRRRGVLLHVRLMATPRAWFPLAPVFGSTRLFRARRCSTFGPSSR